MRLHFMLRLWLLLALASLQTALHMAGARSVVASLWKVPDDATKDRMLDSAHVERRAVERRGGVEPLGDAQAAGAALAGVRCGEAFDERQRILGGLLPGPQRAATPR